MSRDEEIQFQEERRTLTIAAADSDRRFQEALINRQEKTALARLEIEKRSNDITLNTTKANITATLSLIRTLNKNTQAIINQGAPGKGKNVGADIEKILSDEQKRHS